MYLGMWIWSRQPAGVETEHQDEEEDHTTLDATPVIQEQEIEATVYSLPTKIAQWKIGKNIVCSDDCDRFRFQ